jgi:hypothetical protein
MEVAAGRGLDFGTRLAANSFEPLSWQPCYFLTRSVCPRSLFLVLHMIRFLIRQAPALTSKMQHLLSARHCTCVGACNMEIWQGHGTVPHHSLSERTKRSRWEFTDAATCWFYATVVVSFPFSVLA